MKDSVFMGDKTGLPFTTSTVLEFPRISNDDLQIHRLSFACPMFSDHFCFLLFPAMRFRLVVHVSNRLS